MTTQNRDLVKKWWSEAWTDGLWAGSWSKSLDVTPEQAAWQPASAPGVTTKRHSIHQLVLHMIFWRESWLRRAATGQKPTKEEVAAGSVPANPPADAQTWAATRLRFEQTQEKMAAALADPSPANDTLIYFLPHDIYHFGQINYLRAMQGLPPIE